MIDNQSAYKGAIILLSDYLELKAGERLYVILDRRYQSFYGESVCYLEEAARRLGGKISVVEDKRIDDHPGCDFRDWYQDLEADVYLFAGRAKSHRKREGLAIAKEGARVFRSFDFGVDLLESAFQTPKKVLVSLNDWLISKGEISSKAFIRSSDGTDLQIDFDSKFPWTDSHGTGSGQFPGVFPPGEVSTLPANVNGVVVASGALNSSVSIPCSPIIDSYGLTLEFRNSWCHTWRAESTLLQQTLDALFTVDNARRIGEFGIGTNLGVTRFVPFLSHINERKPGPHIGMGTPTQLPGTTSWSSLVHLDVIVPGASVWFDDQLVYDGSEFVEPLISNAAMPAKRNRLLVDAL